MSLLSTVTITKNSKERIESVVQNALEFANEVIVIDTGSTDSTPQLAQNAGAQVFHYEETFDFSSARNFGNQQVTSEWAFHFDDDETFDSKLFRDKLRDSLKNSKENQYLVVQDNFHQGRHVSEVHQSRILRMGQNIKFQGLVYEWLSNNLNTFCLDVAITNSKDITPPNLYDQRERLAKQEFTQLLNNQIPKRNDDTYVVTRLRHLYGLLEGMDAMIAKATMEGIFNDNKVNEEIAVMCSLFSMYHSKDYKASLNFLLPLYQAKKEEVGIDALHLLAASYTQLEDYENALAKANLLKEKSIDHRAPTLISGIHVLRGEYQKAVESFSEVYERIPTRQHKRLLEEMKSRL